VKILFVEDDDETANHVAWALRKENHIVERARDGQEGQLLARTRSHDVAIVDRMIPVLDGLTLVKTLRAEKWKVPVLFLTTMGSIEDRVEGLAAGGDDYLVKPFAMSELIARVHALTRRADRNGAEFKTHLRVGELELDLVARSACRAGKLIPLQAQEYRIVEYLARHAGQVITRTMLLENVWQLHFDPGTNIVESHMSRIRAKLDRPFPDHMIETVRGLGYMLHAA
jgi:two-component system OmpR family response regulator